MNITTTTFKEIAAWQKAHELVIKIYKTTKIFPEWERYGLSSQFQRAAVSVPANIAEGYKKVSRADKLRFLNIAQGSLEECRYYVLLSRDLGYINQHTFDILDSEVDVVGKLLAGYYKGRVQNNHPKDI